MSQFALLVVEPEQKGCHDLGHFPLRGRLPAHANHDAVGRAMVLHLGNSVALSRPVWHVKPLRDNAIEARKLEPLEPALRHSDISRCERGVEWQLLDTNATFRERKQVYVLALSKQYTEGDEASRYLAGKSVDAALCRVKAHLP